MDGENVQPGAVPEGTVSTEADTKSVETDKETQSAQPLTQAQISKMIEDALAPAKEAALREIQSVKDRAAAEVEKARRKATINEDTLNQVRGTLKEADPNLASQLELAELRARDQHHKEYEMNEGVKQQLTAFDQAFHTGVNQFLGSLGIDPKDTRLDWGSDAKDYLEKRNRIDNSVGKILSENRKEAEKKMTQDFKTLESKIRKELGLDSVDTSHSATKSSDEQFLLDYADGKVSDHKRAKQILDKQRVGG